MTSPAHPPLGEGRGVAALVATAAVVTVLERMLSAGIEESRARGHLERGCVRVDGEAVTDPSTPPPWPMRWAVTASS